MYGYIRISKPELKIKDYEAYRAFYCTLCDTLAKRYGPSARMLLSYDATFFAIFSLAADGAACAFQKKRCAVFPFKKCIKAKNAQERMAFAADLTVILAWFKLRDNLQDGSFFEKALSVLLLPFVLFKFRKAKRLNPALCDMTRSYFYFQFRTENDPRTGVDASAEPSGRFFSQLAAQLCETENKAAFARFGYCLGRFVYLSDAADDIEKDLKKKNFNPFISVFQINEETMKQAVDEFIPVLELTAAAAQEAYRRCEIKNYTAITDNIVILGLEEQTDRIKMKYKGVKT